MSKSISLARAILTALVAFSSCLIMVSSSASARIDQSNAFTITQHVLEAFYPEVFGNGRYLNVSTGQPTDDVSWGHFFGFEFKITRFSPSVSWNPTYDLRTGKMASRPENSTFLEGSTWVGFHGEIIQFFVSGDFAHSQQNAAIRGLVESHPEWSEEQEIHALNEAGAKYGPAERDQFIKSLDLEKADKPLGRLKILLVEFNPPSPDHVGNFASGALDWVVHAEAGLPDGTRIKYSFAFEPFEGKLIGIHRVN